jgi:hypothetical protein
MCLVLKDIGNLKGLVREERFFCSLKYMPLEDCLNLNLNL